MPTDRVQRRLAAIAIADVVGYSRMMGRDECGTLAALTERRKQIIEPLVADHQGRVVKLLGDGFFLEFGSAVDAVEAALELQARMSEANAGLPEAQKLVLRIGVNLGEVIVEGDDLYGDGVNVAARLESIAPAGGIAISGSAFDQVKGRIQAEFEDTGLQSLKNIAAPVRVFHVRPKHESASLQPGGNSEQAASHEAERPSIAILPFANLGGDPEQGFFSDGITEDVITELSRWRKMSVRSRTASFQYRGEAVDVKQVARALDVRYIVEGSVRRMGQRIRVTAQLIDVESGSHLWAEKYDRAVDDIFQLQDEMVRTIVATVVGRVQAAVAERARRKPPSSLAAYECVLKGNAVAWDTPEGLAEAGRLFERAIALDPEYGLAHALLGAVLYTRWRDVDDSPDDLLKQAEALGRRAVALDEQESTCHSMLSYTLLHQHRFQLALHHAERAAALNPTNQWNVADMGGLLMFLGRPQEALDQFTHAREIDPYLEESWYWRYVGQSHMLLGQYAQALEAFSHVAVPNFRLNALVAGCHARLGEENAAAVAARACLKLKPNFSIAAFMRKEPFQLPAQAQDQAESLRMAGLPE